MAEAESAAGPMPNLADGTCGYMVGLVGRSCEQFGALEMGDRPKLVAVGGRGEGANPVTRHLRKQQWAGGSKAEWLRVVPHRW